MCGIFETNINHLYELPFNVSCIYVCDRGCSEVKCGKTFDLHTRAFGLRRNYTTLPEARIAFLTISLFEDSRYNWGTYEKVRIRTMHRLTELERAFFKLFPPPCYGKEVFNVPFEKAVETLVAFRKRKLDWLPRDKRQTITACRCIVAPLD